MVNQFKAIPVALTLAAVLSACGGSNSSTPAPAPVPVSSSSIAPSTNYAGVRLNPNAQPGQPGSGAAIADWDAASCSDLRQKNWVRSTLNEDYLFYKDAPLTVLDPNTFTASPPELFEAYTTKALPQNDRFSFVITQAESDATFQAGTSTDLGFALQRETGTNLIRIGFTEPNSSAGKAGVMRGGILATVNQQPAVTTLSRDQINALFNSAPGTQVKVGIQTAQNEPITEYNLTSSTYSSVPVLINKVLPGTNVGYLVYNNFSAPVGETQLADAFKGFAQAGVTDLVLDLRYNSGGSVFIGSQLAYMVAGQAQTSNKDFLRFTYNDKRTAENVSFEFLNKLTDTADPARNNEPLAALNLQRIFVLTTGETCSVSEDFANALSGIGVKVILIGSTTCGKPYISRRTNNCALSYYPIVAVGQNNDNTPVPVSGITPTCAVADDYSKNLGDPTEKMLAAALTYQTTGSCPAGTSNAISSPRKPENIRNSLEFVPFHKRIAVDKRFE
jgi:carboxyl-terminal processing protease